VWGVSERVIEVQYPQWQIVETYTIEGERGLHYRVVGEDSERRP